MAKGVLPEAIVHYIRSTYVQESPQLVSLREETSTLAHAGLQIEPEQGQFLSLLVKLMGAVRTLEVGVFTGYSSLWTVGALPPEGKHVALELDEEITKIARRHWQAAGVDEQIELIHGLAVDSLDRLVEQKAVFDFIFIDADKPNYCNYFERAVQLVRPNGLIAIDNTIWRGQILDDEDISESTVAVRQLNELVSKDPRVEAILVPIGDGITLARKNSDRS